MQYLSDLAKKKQARAKVYRDKKNNDSGKEARPSKTHPTGAAIQQLLHGLALGESDVEEQIDNEETEDVGLVLNPAVQEEIGRALQKRGIVASGKVTGVCQEVVFDTGCTRTVCGTRQARECGLRRSHARVHLLGLGGRRSAWISQPTSIELGGKSIKTTIAVVDEEFPLLMGMEDMSNLDVSIRVKDRSINFGGCTVPMGHQAKPADMFFPTDKSSSVSSIDIGKLVIRDRVGPQLDEEQKNKVVEVFMKYRHVWEKPLAGQCKRGAVKITVIGKPVKQKLRRLSEPMKEELDKQVEGMLKAGIIRPSKSEWSSCPVFVKKPDGTWRMCIDYREVNKRIQDNAYAVPLLWDELQDVAGHDLYTTADANWGFFNMPLVDDGVTCQVTAFSTHRGNFEFVVLPFGIKTATGDMQAGMDKSLANLRTRGVRYYIDDIVIFTSGHLDGHLEVVAEVLQELGKAGIFLKLQKGLYAHKAVRLLGHCIAWVSSDFLLMRKRFERYSVRHRLRARKKMLFVFYVA
eukprot:GHVQ01038845.1.p1 GENE.GHVQ01038845.1~~GHVQ01038845.1.p1  ORF type:complete len:519 (-),score=59.88 GHVQ01038845.1:86-1642(-)